MNVKAIVEKYINSNNNKTRTNAARLSKGKGSRQIKLGKRGRFGPLLLKHIAYDGTFTASGGHEIKLNDEYLSEAVKGCRVLMDNGFKVQNFTDHDTVSSNDVLGTWLAIYYDKKRGDLWGVVEAHSDEAAEKMERLDTSAVFEPNIHIRDDLSVPFAITRIDTVPQGAVTGTLPYLRLSRHLKRGAKKGHAMSFIKALARAFGSESEDFKEVDDAVMAALMSEEASAEDIGEIVISALKEEMQAEESEDKKEMQADDSEESEEKDEMACDSEKDEMAARLARLEKQLVETELSKADIDAKQRKNLLSVYSRTSKKAGHELAFEAIKTALSMRSVSGSKKGVKPAKRQFSTVGKKPNSVAELIRKRYGKGEK